jgi:LPS-assembly protein
VTILAALVAGLIAQAAPLASAPPSLAGDVTVSADRVTYEGGTGRVHLEGHAVVRRGAVTLRARSASYDPESGEVVAQGDVLLTDPTRAISAYAVRAVLGGEVEAQGVVAFVKDQPVDLSGLRSAAEAGRAGRNRLSFSGDRLAGTADRIHLTNARLTLCDCGAAPPSWEVDAREADVIPGKRAILHGAVVRITPAFMDRQVPVLWLPWLYVPLGERQSGLLLPTIGSTHAGGFTVAQPLYLTLGRSADLTLTPEYFFGRNRADAKQDNEAISGPGANLELRWAPAEGAEGRVEAAWLDDGADEPRGAHGSRWAVAGDHLQRAGATDLQASLRLAGDGVWLRDTSADALVRALPYHRSDVLATRRTDAVVAEIGGSYDQPLLPSGYEPGVRWGTLGAARQVGSRLGGATATVLPEALGPLRLSGRVGASRFGPVEGARDLVGRPSVGRADARLELSLPLLLGRAVTVAPYVRGAGVGYSFDVGEHPAAEGWGVAGAVVQTEVSRRFGDLRHLVAPRVEWRGGSDVVGHRLAFRAYDPFDRTSVGLLSAAAGPFQQLRLSVASRLEGPERTLVSGEVGQDADLRAGRWSEAFAKLAGGAGPLSADAGVRFFPIDPRPGPLPAARIPSKLDELSEVQANLAVQDRRGDALRLGFLSVGPGGSGALLTGLDPLFDVRAAGLDPGASATAGVKAALGPVRVSYDVLFPGRPTFVAACNTGANGETSERRVSAWQAQQHVASVAWESPCRCFRVVANASINDCGAFSYRFSLDLSRAMAAGTAAAR